MTTALAMQSVASLPSLVKQAARKLEAATSAAEVLDAKAMASVAYDAAKSAARFAKAKGAFDEVVTAVYRAQADALEIEAMAKRRIADEYDAAQKRNEISSHGGDRSKFPDEKLAPASKVIPPKELHNARKVRDAEESDPGIVRRTLDALLEAGQEPTKAAVERAITGDRLSSFSGDNEWYTPSKYIELARSVLGTIDLDPASNRHAQKTVKAEKYYTIERSGLEKPWSGCVWMNPPYSNPEIQLFTDKVLSEFKSKNISSAIVLTNNSGDTAWHHSLGEACSAMCIMRGRIKFESPTRESNSPAMGQSFFYFGRNPDNFARVFSGIGRIYQHYIFDAALTAANDNEPRLHKHAA
jgi:phage N-6-adenine-methyltransferase